jgi:hypothetical protein
VQYQIQANSRRCARTGRELQPGERIFSVLYEREGQWVREDVASDAWTGPPPQAFSFWQTRVPSPKERRRLLVDDDMLRELFERLEKATEVRQVQFRYLLALWLMRRKALRFEAVQRSDDQEWLVLRDARTGREVVVLDPRLDDSELEEVQGQLQNLLAA